MTYMEAIVEAKRQAALHGGVWFVVAEDNCEDDDFTIVDDIQWENEGQIDRIYYTVDE